MNYMDFLSDERGVNTVVGFILTLAISTALISILVIGATSFLSVQQGSVIQTQMDVAGNQLASDIEATDRYVKANDGVSTSLETTTTLPRNFAGADYTITIEEDVSRYNTYTLVFTTTNPRFQWAVPVISDTPIQTGELRGGEIAITYNGSELVITNA